MIPERFCTQIPQRMRSLIDAMKPVARERDLLTSFALMAAMPILIIPLERVAKKGATGSNEINDLDVAPRFARDWQQKRRGKFIDAFVADREERFKWRYLELPRDQIEQPGNWRDPPRYRQSYAKDGRIRRWVLSSSIIGHKGVVVECEVAASFRSSGGNSGGNLISRHQKEKRTSPLSKLSP